MKLRGIEIKNWACIESLSLTGLGDGVVILHGPNRTGKSSVVQAIRSALFDHFHDSQDGTLLAALPWRTKATPHVAIEFEHAGQRYRISKTFAKTREGQATLEMQNGGGWTVLERAKEAAKRVRELIGVESSECGVFQMLWLGQRDFTLPNPRAIDRTLAAALESVLGTLITGRDLKFKERLDKACERWFTVKTMKDQKNSPALKLAAELEAARAHQVEVERIWTEAETALKQYDEAVARQPELKGSLEAAESELARAQKECEAVRQRKMQHDLTVQSLQQCERLLKQAEQRLSEFDAAACEFESVSKEAENVHLELRSAEEQRAQAERDVAGAHIATDAADQKVAQHQLQRATLEDRQRLIANRLEQDALADKNRYVEELDEERQRLEQLLVGPAPTECRIKELRAHRDKAAQLRARVEAGEIHVTIDAKKPLTVEITADGGPASTSAIPAREERRLLIRQHAEITLDDVAVLRVGRGKEDHDLEALARELDEIERSLRDELKSAKLDPADPSALDQLAARRLQHDESTRQLNSVREQIAKTAPSGIPALQAQLHQKRADEEVLLDRRPELRDWTPDQSELDHLRRDFEECECKLKAAALDAKRTGERHADLLRAATQVEQTLRETLAGHGVRVQSLREQLGRKDRPSHLRERDDAATQHAEATRKVVESTLSDAEQAMEAQYQNLRAAHANRAKRLRDNEDLLLRLQTQLAGTEGLHQKRIQAEQAVNDLTRNAERERLYADAHKHLKDLFEEVRQAQVRRTVGPINDRVMQWAASLGLTDYAGLAFADQLLPAGLLPNHAPDGETVEMDRESYGTMEQLSLLIRLAVGGLLARNEPAVAILDDPLAHADPGKHRKMLDILARAARGEPHGPHPTGPLQLIILTCHEDRFDYLDGAQQFDLAQLIHRGG